MSIGLFLGLTWRLPRKQSSTQYSGLEVQREIKYFIIIVRLSKQEVILDQSQFVDVMKYICGIEIIVSNKRNTLRD